MSGKLLVILDRDKEFATARIAQLDADIIALGPEFYEAFNQTSETWHDNAPFEVVRDKQSVMNAELHTLRRILRESSTSVPKQNKKKVGIGCFVTIRNRVENADSFYYVAGDWTPFAGEKLDDSAYTIISRRSPIGQSILNLSEGQEFQFRKVQYTIMALDYSL